MPTVYLAGPQVFTPYGRAYIRETVMPPLTENGFDPVFPMELGDEERLRDALAAEGQARADALHDWAADTGAANRDAIDRADAVLANLDGADVDSGTAAEIAHAAATGTPVVGYRTDTREAGENEGVAVNLQVETFIADSDGRVVVPSGAVAADTDRYRTYTDEDDMFDRIVAELERVTGR